MEKNRRHIRGIVDELLSNAIKAQASKIEVLVEEQGDEVCIRVIDNGHGIDGRKMEVVEKHLYQPRRDEIEDYYGALAGDSAVGTGLSLVGMMTDRASLKTALGCGTEITVYRRLRDSKREGAR